MKKLFLLRHAKSSWKNPNLADFDRPLNKRGTKNAFLIAERFKAKNVDLNLIISSSSKRTLTTTQIFAHTLDYKNEIIFTEMLYLASSHYILKIFQELDENTTNVLIVCHNPGITELANYLGNDFIENIPTSGIVGFSFEGRWKDLLENCCKLLFFDYPKKH